MAEIQYKPYNKPNAEYQMIVKHINEDIFGHSILPNNDSYTVHRAYKKAFNHEISGILDALRTGEEHTEENHGKNVVFQCFNFHLICQALAQFYRVPTDEAEKWEGEQVDDDGLPPELFVLYETGVFPRYEYFEEGEEEEEEQEKEEVKRLLPPPPKKKSLADVLKTKYTKQPPPPIELNGGGGGVSSKVSKKRTIEEDEGEDHDDDNKKKEHKKVATTITTTNKGQEPYSISSFDDAKEQGLMNGNGHHYHSSESFSVKPPVGVSPEEAIHDLINMGSPSDRVKWSAVVSCFRDGIIQEMVDKAIADPEEVIKKMMMAAGRRLRFENEFKYRTNDKDESGYIYTRKDVPKMAWVWELILVDFRRRQFQLPESSFRPPPPLQQPNPYAVVNNYGTAGKAATNDGNNGFASSNFNVAPSKKVGYE